MGINSFIPGEAVGHTARVVLMGRDSLLVEQHRGIISYTEEKLILRLRDGYMTIRGENLKISEYTGCSLAASGIVQSVEFS